MQLTKLLTEMTDDELKEHLASLRKAHSTGATTTVRRQTVTRNAKPKESLRDRLSKMSPDALRQLKDLLS